MWRLQESPNKYEGRIRPLTRIGIHSTETPANSARGVANYLAKPASKASAHIVVGTDEIVQCVKAADTAWAMPKVNANGFQIEICGYAKWTAEQWIDCSNFGWAACVAAELIKLTDFVQPPIKIKWLTDAEVRSGSGSGLIKHSTATRVLGGSHTDPGTGFPVDKFIDYINWWYPHITNVDFQ